MEKAKENKSSVILFKCKSTPTVIEKTKVNRSGIRNIELETLEPNIDVLYFKLRVSFGHEECILTVEKIFYFEKQYDYRSVNRHKNIFSDTRLSHYLLDKAIRNVFAKEIFDKYGVDILENRQEIFPNSQNSNLEEEFNNLIK